MSGEKSKKRLIPNKMRRFFLMRTSKNNIKRINGQSAPIFDKRDNKAAVPQAGLTAEMIVGKSGFKRCGAYYRL